MGSVGSLACFVIAQSRSELSFMHFMMEEALVGAVTLAASVAVVRHGHALTSFRSRLSLKEAQSVHSRPVPRLGGLAVFCSVVLSTLLVNPQLTANYAMFVIGMLPLIFVGLYEDIIGPTKAMWRVFAIALSCIFVILALGVWLPRSGLVWLDPWIAGYVGIVITVLLVIGVCNSFNLIDGLNGLSTGVALAAFFALHEISQRIGFEIMSDLTMMYVVSLAIVLFFNFPIARLFLGDSGAYLLGFILAWFAISILIKDSSVSPWVFLLILAYPITELLFTISRRLFCLISPLRADKHHLHHYVFRALSEVEALRNGKNFHNALASLCIVPLAVTPMFYAVKVYNKPDAILIAYGFFLLAYLIQYFALKRYLKKPITELKTV
jgi:UDP-GlcNAc:undecaprenyl-phosphate/decaprenyl-phosphate GlcNAc-1-phosphate transferase